MNIKEEIYKLLNEWIDICKNPEQYIDNKDDKFEE